MSRHNKYNEIEKATSLSARISFIILIMIF